LLTLIRCEMRSQGKQVQAGLMQKDLNRKIVPASAQDELCF